LQILGRNGWSAQDLTTLGSQFKTEIAILPEDLKQIPFAI